LKETNTLALYIQGLLIHPKPSTQTGIARGVYWMNTLPLSHWLNQNNDDPVIALVDCQLETGEQRKGLFYF
jgi:hypothetical protein